MKKVIVRSVLYVEEDGRRIVAGARHFRGETVRRWPRECIDAEGEIRTDFDTPEEAARAADKLTVYLAAVETARKNQK